MRANQPKPDAAEHSAIAEPSRLTTAVSFGWLLGLGLIFLAVLVRDDDDNAYLFLVMVGAALGFVSAPFALATVLPHGIMRRLVVRGAIVLLWIAGAFSVLWLVVSLLIIPSQDYDGNEVFLSHLVGLLLLLPTLFVIGYRFQR